MAETRDEPSVSGVQKNSKSPLYWLDIGLNVVEKYILIVGILAMASVSVLNVIARNIGHSISFADEVAQLLVVVVTFVGVGHGVRNARHIRVSAIHDMLPPMGQKILLIIVSFVSCALLALLATYAWDYVMRLANSGRVMPSLGVPLWYVYIIAPIGLAIGSAQFFLAGVRNLISPGAWLSWHNRDEYEDEIEAIAAEAGMEPELVAVVKEQQLQEDAGTRSGAEPAKPEEKPHG